MKENAYNILIRYYYYIEYTISIYKMLNLGICVKSMHTKKGIGKWEIIISNSDQINRIY